MKKIFNIISKENNAQIVHCTSNKNEYPISNILLDDLNLKWVSSSSLPQIIIIDISNLNYHPEYIKAFGIQCCYSKTSNPKKIEILFKKKKEGVFVSLGVFDFYLKKDVQLYTFDEKPIYFLDVTHIQIVILETYGDNRTFMNKFYIFEDITIDESNPVDTNQPTCTNYNINTTSFTTSSAINNNNININYAYNANNNNNGTLFTNYLTSISNTNGNVDLIETTSNINNHNLNSDISVKKKPKSKPKVNSNQITKLFKTHFDQKISTIEEEVLMINKKIDLFINKLNCNTPISSPNILSLQSYTTNGNNCINKQNNMQKAKHKRWHSKAYMNKIREKKINITLACLDNQIKHFKINFDNVLNNNHPSKSIYKDENYNHNNIITTSTSSQYMKVPLTNKKSNYYNTTRNEYCNQTNSNSNTKRISHVVTQSQTNPNTMIITENYLHSNKKLIPY